jgi:hypothetical protein
MMTKICLNPYPGQKRLRIETTRANAMAAKVSNVKEKIVNK